MVVDDGGEYGNMVAIGLIVVVGRYIPDERYVILHCTPVVLQKWPSQLRTTRRQRQAKPSQSKTNFCLTKLKTRSQKPDRVFTSFFVRPSHRKRKEKLNLLPAVVVQFTVLQNQKR